ncbi:hypothetical protein RHGRI_031417 [Rhododendron griersonianum]|uniref:Uncharacterized protein n=1 Tax=Rhododendron griersonianum TaxID=479676 RepID=A0AAV6IAD7_9ERIC|nr:hypothetical protein RHGRI_031417 [Rhododendron griersonianum]
MEMRRNVCERENQGRQEDDADVGTATMVALDQHWCVGWANMVVPVGMGGVGVVMETRSNRWMLHSRPPDFPALSMAASQEQVFLIPLHHPGRVDPGTAGCLGDTPQGLDNEIHISCCRWSVCNCSELNDLNDRQEFNGDLMNSIRFYEVSKGQRRLKRVKFVGITDLGVRFPNLQGDDLRRQGVIEDLTQLHDIVAKVAQKDPPNPNSMPPKEFTLFQDQEYRPNASMSYNDLKKLSYFNYSHPIFFNKKRWSKFVYKVHEIQLRDEKYFKKVVTLDKHPTSMVSWVTRVPLNPAFVDDSNSQSSLRQVLYDREKTLPANSNPIGPQNHPFRKRFNKEDELPAYLRIVLEHGRDVNQYTWYGKVLRELRDEFSDALGKIHFSLISNLKNDLTCQQHFGADLVKMLRHSTFGYHGFNP